ALDPIYQSITDRSARDRLVATYDHSITEHEFLMGYNWDIVLTGANRTWMEEDDDDCSHRDPGPDADARADRRPALRLCPPLGPSQRTRARGPDPGRERRDRCAETAPPPPASGAPRSTPRASTASPPSTPDPPSRARRPSSAS